MAANISNNTFDSYVLYAYRHHIKRKPVAFSNNSTKDMTEISKYNQKTHKQCYIAMSQMYRSFNKR